MVDCRLFFFFCLKSSSFSILLVIKSPFNSGQTRELWLLIFVFNFNWCSLADCSGQSFCFLFGKVSLRFLFWRGLSGSMRPVSSSSSSSSFSLSKMFCDVFVVGHSFSPTALLLAMLLLFLKLSSWIVPSNATNIQINFCLAKRNDFLTCDWLMGFRYPISKSTWWKPWFLQSNE